MSRIRYFPRRLREQATQLDRGSLHRGGLHRIAVTRKEDVMKYLVKNLEIHRCAVTSSCKLKYTGERLHDQPPKGYQKCDDCCGLPRLGHRTSVMALPKC